jgi:SH3-like domain-containing protein
MRHGVQALALGLAVGLAAALAAPADATPRPAPRPAAEAAPDAPPAAPAAPPAAAPQATAPQTAPEAAAPAPAAGETAAGAGAGAEAALRIGGSGRPLPRFASLEARQGNARRGPHLHHRIDWVFVRPGMPLKITAEHEHWRRVEDAEGVGGWMHYSLLSVVRTVLVTADMAEIRARPDPRAPVVARAETGAIARVTACRPDWCRITRDGLRGWLPKSALWGVTAEETFD